MTWKKVKIKDIFDFEKGPLQSSKNTPGKYDFITASSERKTHDTFSHEGEHLIFAMAASGSLGRTHYVNGKFISSDLCFILTPKDRNSINMKFYHIYFNLIRKDIVSKTAIGSAKIAINQNNFGNYEIIVGDIKEQDRIFDKINSLAPNIEKLLNIFEDQDLVKKLRQSILQDAIQGKLVPQDPNDEPASELLKKIKKEKEQLIKDKKIKKPKDIAPITDDEIPFDLPKGWEWVRLGEISKNIHYGYTASAENIDTGVKMLRITDIQDNQVNRNTVPFCSISKTDLEKMKLQLDDILIARTGGTVGKTFLIKNVDDVSVFASYLIRVILLSDNFPEYIKLFLESPSYWNQLIAGVTGSAQPNVNAVTLGNLILPLPPLAEQHRIVAKVDELMKFCDGLEKEITEAKENGERLMESVLGEVFR